VKIVAEAHRRLKRARGGAAITALLFSSRASSPRCTADTYPVPMLYLSSFLPVPRTRVNVPGSRSGTLSLLELRLAETLIGSRKDFLGIPRRAKSINVGTSFAVDVGKAFRDTSLARINRERDSRDLSRPSRLVRL